MALPEADTRQQILRAAVKQFAEKGYAGASVQEIVDAACVTKPALYYYFRNKAALYQALVDWAFEERLRLMQDVVERHHDLVAQLTQICATTFAFIENHRELMRLSFASAFAAPGEAPPEAQCMKKGRRNFDFVHNLIRQAARRGELNRAFTSQELAVGFFGMMHLHVMVHLLDPQMPLNRRTARRIVELFLAGAKRP